MTKADTEAVRKADEESVPFNIILARLGRMGFFWVTRFLPVYALGLLSRPLWRRFMRMTIARQEKKENLDQSQLADDSRIWLFYEQRNPWDEIVPCLYHVKNPRTRMDFACAFVLLYLHNRRLEEAIKAAQYWASTSDEWVRENPKAARRVSHLQKKLSGWYLRPQQGEGQDIVDGKEAMKVEKRMGDWNGVMFTYYRNSRVALALLLWVRDKAADRDMSLVLNNLKSTRQEVNPLFPFPRKFDYELATRLGITDEEFDRICADAEKIERYTTG